MSAAVDHVQERVAKKREPTGTQRLRRMASKIGMPERLLAERVKKARCVLCDVELPYMRRYADKQHCCEGCERRLEPELNAALNDLINWV